MNKLNLTLLFQCPLAGSVVSWTPTWLRPRTDWVTRGNPGCGHPWLGKGAGASSWGAEWWHCHHVAASIWNLHRGTKNPKCWVCWPAAQALRRPPGLLKECSSLSLQELKSSCCCGFSIQPEASGQLGEARAAVSWEWLPGAPCGIVCKG